MQVMDAIVEILKREGISTLFCYPTTPIIEAAVAAGHTPRHLPAGARRRRHGDGFARTANGQPPAVFAMQYGPGAENAFPGIASAYSDFVPGCCCFRSAIRARRRRLFPMFKSTRTYASVTKSVEEVTLPGQVVPAMRRAFSPEERPARVRSWSRCRRTW